MDLFFNVNTGLGFNIVRYNIGTAANLKVDTQWEGPDSYSLTPA